MNRGFEPGLSPPQSELPATNTRGTGGNLTPATPIMRMRPDSLTYPSNWPACASRSRESDSGILILGMHDSVNLR